MRVRALSRVGVAGAVAVAAFGFAGPARAESCVTLPGTTGATLEVADQEVRVPATSGVAACVEPGGLPGLPRVDTAGGTVSIVLGAGSSAEGYVAVRYALDGAADEIRVPIPGLGSDSETCLASVGEIVREDCLVKLTVDDLPDPDPYCNPAVGACVPYGGTTLREAIANLQRMLAEMVNWN